MTRWIFVNQWLENRVKPFVFNPHIQNQIQLSPPGLEELVDANHPCRIVNEEIEN